MENARSVDKIEEALQFMKSKDIDLTLKREQEIAIRSLLIGNDVLAVLATGFGKTTIFTVFEIAKSFTSRASIIIVSPLKSIIANQLEELNGLSSATELMPESLKEVVDNPPNYIYTSAEQVLCKDCLDALKDETAHYISA
ncbi:predicted protein [Nematostella vectensis]|uniref:DEAD/DEAH-box helicase domain-containing protein n=1 Tax=Nematostella vectensis TaxID=45351 RepID=A7ST39_NEMVE|nr:predicted protein [Nematostella vectensis]|eukprot:XP_001625234.1 predicted protein [Nematostella vectensis]